MEGKLNSRVIRGKLISVPRIDPTLCKAGQAADAKATGDYLRLLSSGGGISKEIAAHMESRDNPHLVTAAQLGLGQVSNTADAEKPVSLPQQRAIADACGKVKNAALLKSGGTMAGQLSMGGHRLTGLAAPEGAGDGVNKGHLDDYVTQKTAAGVRFSPVLYADGSRALGAGDGGMTIKNAYNRATAYTLSPEDSNGIPEGAEIAIFRNCGDDAKEVTVTFSGGLGFYLPGDDKTYIDKGFRVAEVFGLAAMKKMSPDTWLICGPVEVMG